MTILQALIFGPPPPGAAPGVLTEASIVAQSLFLGVGASVQASRFSIAAAAALNGVGFDQGLVLTAQSFADTAPFGAGLVQVNMARNGAIGYTTNFSGSVGHSADWYLPTTTTIGDSYYMRTSKVPGGDWGAVLTHAETENTWQNMNGANNLITVQQDVGTAVLIGQLLIEISLSSVGPADTSAIFTFVMTHA